MKAQTPWLALLGLFPCLCLLALATTSALGQATHEGEATETMFETAPELWKGCGLEKLSPGERTKLDNAVRTGAAVLGAELAGESLRSAQPTRTGLQGVKRVRVEVVCEKEVEDIITPNTIKSLVELQIRKAAVGLDVAPSGADGDGELQLSFAGLTQHYRTGAETGWAFVSADLHFSRSAFLVSAAEGGPAWLWHPVVATYEGLGLVWSAETPEIADKAKAWAKEQVDVFLNEWMKANPKKP